MHVIYHSLGRYGLFYSCRGFTLVELALVLIIMSVVLVKLIQPLSVSMTQRQYDKTQEVLNEIKLALLGYAQIHGKLPCADLSGNGKNNPGCTNFENNSEGDIPWADLGVEGKDAWGRIIRYRPYDKYTIIDPITTKIGFHNNNGLIIRYALDTDNDGIEDQKTTTTSRIAAILFSLGPNGKADLCNNRTLLLCPNSSGRIYYTQDAPIQSADGLNDFDDMLIWIPRNVLVRSLNQVGKWTP
jgi:prepilin-type N-terminal cleavage/methylation domain-containing protein